MPYTRVGNDSENDDPGTKKVLTNTIPELTTQDTRITENHQDRVSLVPLVSCWSLASRDTSNLFR